MATHSSILAWRIPWTEEPGGPWGRKELDMTERLHFTLALGSALELLIPATELSWSSLAVIYNPLFISCHNPIEKCFMVVA